MKLIIADKKQKINRKVQFEKTLAAVSTSVKHH